MAAGTKCSILLGQGSLIDEKLLLYAFLLFMFTVGPTDCIVEGEVLKLGGPFLQTWQKKHLKLYPNRLEFYTKNRDGQIVKGKGVEVRMINGYVLLLI